MLRRNIRLHPGFGIGIRYQFTLGSKPQDGHPPTPGSKIDKLHKWCVTNIDQGKIFHAGKMVSVFCIFTTDFVTLRILLAIAPLFSILFHFLFPVPRPARMFYGLFFFVGHISALAFFLYSKSDWLWPIENDEFEAIYEKSFKPFEVSKWEFRQFCGGEFRSDRTRCEDEHGSDGRLLARIEKYEHGDIIVHQGNDMRSIWLLVDGHGYFARKADKSDRPLYEKASLGVTSGSDSSSDGGKNVEAARDRLYKIACESPQKLSEVYSGSWIGEIFDKTYDWGVPHHWRVDFVCSSKEGCTVLRIPKKQFHDFIIANPHCELSCHLMQLKDLWIARRTTAVGNIASRMQIEELETELREARGKLEAVA